MMFLDVTSEAIKTELFRFRDTSWTGLAIQLDGKPLAFVHWSRDGYEVVIYEKGNPTNIVECYKGGLGAAWRSAVLSGFRKHYAKG